MLSLVGLAWVVFARGLDSPFIYDDIHALVQNPHVRTLWPPWYAAWAPEQSSLAGRPLVSFSFALNYAATGLSPVGFRAVNITLHGLCAGLLLLLLGALPIGAARKPMPLAAAWGVAAVWVVHPLHAETVVYLIQRTELMVALCYVGTLWCALESWRRQGEEGQADAVQGPWRPWAAGAVLLCAAGMLCKEVMVSAPLAVLLFDRAFAAGTFAEALRRRWRWYVALCATWAILVAMMLSNPRNLSAGFDLDVTPLEYLLTQAQILPWYFSRIAYPVGQTVHHGWSFVRDWRDAVAGGTLVLALLVATGIALWRRPRVGAAGACVWLILAPTSSVIPIVTEPMAERRMYLPLAVVLGLVMVGLLSLARRMKMPRESAGRMLGGAAAVCAAVFAIVTVSYLATFASAVTIWARSVELYPRDPLARNNLGVSLAQAGQPVPALRQLRKAIALGPDYGLAYLNYGATLLKMGETQGVETALERAIELDDQEAAAWAALGKLRRREERWADAQAAYERALALDPRNVSALEGMGVVRGQAGDYASSIAYLKRAVAIDPTDPDVRDNLGVSLLFSGDPDAAIVQFQTILDNHPNHQRARRNLEAARIAQRQAAAAGDQ